MTFCVHKCTSNNRSKMKRKCKCAAPQCVCVCDVCIVFAILQMLIIAGIPHFEPISDWKI